MSTPVEIQRTPATKRPASRRRGPVLAVAAALAFATVAIGGAPALAGNKPPKGGTVTTTTTTTTTAPPTFTDFVQWEDAASLELAYEPGTVADDDSTTSKAGATAAIGSETSSLSFGHGSYRGSMYSVVNKSTNASAYWERGITGAGVDVALIDTGVTPVDGLTYPGKVINGPDLSFDSQAANLRYLDAHGHGTHLAGIIAGRSDAASDIKKNDSSNFLGMAPGARIVNVKVGDAYGAVDVSQVIAAIDWIVQHKDDNGMNIRVIALAYGTDGVQAYQVDPLVHAVEMAWQAGIVVVVAAGNDGNGAQLRNPAYDPFVIAVGASENSGSASSAADDTVPTFSSCGTSQRSVDLVAPGKTIVSLRNPGSVADTEHPQARVGDSYFVGSGTSQAAAVVSGAVALLLEQHPELTPDQVKRLLTDDSAERLTDVGSLCQGAGNLDMAAALRAPVPQTKRATQSYEFSDGSGSLDAARGSFDLYDNGVVLEGEIDIMGSSWSGYTCPTSTACQSLWDGGSFNGASWSGASWSGASWSGASWSGASWSGASWSGASWSSKTWSGASWSGASWSGASWSGASWSGASWSGASWSNTGWE